MKTTKKLNVGLLALFAAGVCLTSCDSDTLSTRLAKKAINKEAMFRDSSQYVRLNTGYYEVDNNDLDQLQKLKKAGLITLKEETVIEKKVRYTSGWYNRQRYTVDVTHTFATVSLTEEGQKYAITNVPTTREDEEEDLALLEKTTEEEPDYMKDTTTNATTANENTVTAETEEEDYGELESAPLIEEEEEAGDAYSAALTKSNITHHCMLTGRYKLLKVKQVFCPEEAVKQGQGSCVAVYEFTDKTPFGYILGAPQQGERFSKNVVLQHYDDMGWLVNMMN